MSTYTVAEFRKNIRKALDQATQGYVFIKRHDKVFMVSLDTVDLYEASQPPNQKLDKFSELRDKMDVRKTQKLKAPPITDIDEPTVEPIYD